MIAMSTQNLPTDASVLWQDYLRLKSVFRVGAKYHVSGQTICNRLAKGGFAAREAPWHTGWSNDDVDLLTCWYKERSVNDQFHLDELASRLGRLKSNVSRKARSLGLTNIRRPRVVTRKQPPPRKFATDAERRANTGRVMKEYFAKNGHPRGMLGKHHSVETRRGVSARNKARYANMTRADWRPIIEKTLKTRIARYGSAAGKARGRGSWKAGWRDIGSQRIYFRSRWEANYARYLEWLRGLGEIAEWKHEPETFWFEKIKRGARSYLPDFKVVWKDGTVEYHEVKGWMDSRSRTVLRRMRIYHPEVTMMLKDGAWFRDNHAKLAGLVPGWERGKRVAHW